MLAGLSTVFETRDSDASARYALLKTFAPGTVDGVYVGSSAVSAFLIPSQLFEEYGFAVQPMASSALGAQGVLPYLKEARRLLHPSLYLINLQPFVTEQSAEEAVIWGRVAMDAMDFFSPERLELAVRTQEYAHLLDPEHCGRSALRLFFPVLQSHGRWQEDDFSAAQALWRQPAGYLGAYVSESESVHAESIPVSEYTNELLPFGKPQETYLRELIGYLKENHLSAVFILNPRSSVKEECAKLNAAVNILRECDMEYKDFNTREIFTSCFDPERDFMNIGHTNYYGAVKFTRLLGEYLNENGFLPNRRGDARYAGWQDVNRQLRAKMDALALRDQCRF